MSASAAQVGRKKSPELDHAPFGSSILYIGIILAKVNISTKFEVSSFSLSKDKKEALHFTKMES